MNYRIIDLQKMDTHKYTRFGKQETFKNKEEIRQHLIDYHSVDYEGKKPIEKFTLEEILDYGDWDFEEVL